MSKYKSLFDLSAKSVYAPAHSQERFYLQIITETLDKAAEIAKGPTKSVSLVDKIIASEAIGKGSIFDDES